MPDAQSLIAEVDSKLSNASTKRHSAILRRLTDLFLTGAETYSDDHVALFDDIIGHLIAKSDPAALIELSARLAPIRNAPRRLVGHLSRNDDMAISAPLLGNSSVLTDDILVEIAGTKSQRHLAAIAGRARISEAVTDILIHRGDATVARKVTDNQSARLSELGFVKLINRAKDDRGLAVAIENRTDLPSELQPFLKLTLV
ncbi:MAG TPA: DUF2336 domain-containing protein [Xanthobacteraceae bacterium]|nr:DUF2336 domain-containing protein [Xanthobacteraceae bacterium]